MEILCVIPCRSGSKRIKDKNIKKFKGKPLIYWSILQAKLCKYKPRIIVSTDSENYKKIALKFGAEVPFLRPKNISKDYSIDFDFFQHCLNFLNKKENYHPDLILHLRPTQPLRKVKDIDKSLGVFIKNIKKYDSLRSVYPFEKTPYKMYYIEKNNLKPFIESYNNYKEPYNLPSQIFPKCYIHNGYIDIFKSSLIKKNKISGNRVYPYVMDKTSTVDIDTIEDWKKHLL